MSQLPLFLRLAEYNRWMNDKLYAATARLPTAERDADRGAYFGSVVGTLNHLVVADLIWLRRFAQLDPSPAVLAELADWPVPDALAQTLYAEFDELARRRVALDALIQRFVAALNESDLSRTLDYRNTQGVPARRELAGLLLHFFNHQTHHRGQATTLLTQAGQDVGVTDLLALLPNQAPA